ncbi:MAG: hypothetical protein ACI8W8_000309 [Rhodothermales bacterium]|jgi:hypothetical protein
MAKGRAGAIVRFLNDFIRYEVAVKHAFLSLAVIALLAGCGGSEGPSVDTEQFRAPIDAWLAAESMDLAIKEFKDASTDDAAGTAHVAVSMGFKDPDMGSVAVTYLIDFKKGDDGAWSVTAGKQKN